MKTIRFGIIGCGLMGREFASAAARWAHLPQMDVRPEIVAVCDTNDALLGWYRDNFPAIQQITGDYKQLLANDAVDAVYIAVPHHLHQEMYCAAICAGKHLLGEKPFGIDKPANEAITACAAEHPEVFVRCASEFPFYPGVQRIARMIEEDAFGRIIQVEAGFLHSSDLNAEKPLNWKRMIEINGEYGCLGDLGMHICHVPFRAGWIPKNVRAILSDIIPQRPDADGNLVPCKTWENATLLCETVDPISGEPFPMTLKTQRVMPGEKNTWYIEVFGVEASARFSTKNPRELQLLEYTGGEQVWGRIDTGHEMAVPSITGGIFEAGFCDVILQMWAPLLWEMQHGQPPARFAGCVTVDEVAVSHRLFTAALESHKNATTVAL